MTPNQAKAIALRPHLAGRILGNETGEPLPTVAVPRRVELQVCEHRGKMIDKTTCRCLVYTCEIHGTCSNNSRAGLTVCPCEHYKAAGIP